MEGREASESQPERVDGTGVEQQAGADEVVAAEEHGDELCEQHQLVFDLTILVPRAAFSSNCTAKASPNGSKDALDNYIPLFLPSSGADILRDIRQTVAESPEGFWIGMHSFQRVMLKEQTAQQEGEEPKVVLEGEPSEILEDNVDLAHVFDAEIYKNPETRRALKVVETPYTDVEARAHVLRVRDASLGYSVALQTKRLYQPPPYDPNALVVEGGLSVFSSLRGPVAEDGEQAAVNGDGILDAQTNGHLEDNAQNGKKSKGKGKAKAAPKLANAPTPQIPKKTDSETPSASWLSDNQGPLDTHLDRKTYMQTSALPPSSFKNLSLSVWNPPPQHLRMRGHFLYLNVTTLEGDSLHVTGSQAGFYVNKSDNHHFDASPRQGTKSNTSISQTYHSLFNLLSAVSPQFASKTRQMLADTLPSSPDIFASAAITHCLPAGPWLTPLPQIVADSTRSQMPYMLTGSTGLETLPVARDWNEESTAMRELPRATSDDRLVRDRFGSRLSAEFQSAAARGVACIVRGDVPSLNALDTPESRSYLFHNILFTQALDTVNLMKHVGGDEAARISAAKDLQAAVLLSHADIPNLHTVATAVVDYCGERWVAQAIPPGIFNRAPEEPKAEDSSSATDEKAENGEKAAPTLGIQTGLRAVYGPKDTDKPSEGFVAEESFAPMAEKIAQQFHLAKHTVSDNKGNKTELWTPADVHGVVAADGRSYVIDLCRMFPVDVNFLEQNMECKIFSDEEAIQSTSEDTYPHRITLLRPELVELYHGTKTREWIEEQVKEKTAQDETVKKDGETKAITEDGDKSLDGPDSATSDDFVQVDKEVDGEKEEAKEEQPKQKEQTIIDVGNFKLAFNPDAFVDKPDQALHSASSAKPEEEDESTKTVRDASNYLRQTVIPSLFREILADEIIPLDSSHLSQLLHKKGINIRYLGLLAEESKKLPEIKQASEEVKQETAAFLAKFRNAIIRDMVVRGSKHVLRRHTAGLRTVELAEAISHFLNCLLGASHNPSPKAVNTTGSTSAWTKLTPESLRIDIVAEMRRRFRYAVPAILFEQELPKPQLLREICLSSGVQLVLQPYNFEKTASAPQTNGTHSDEETTKDKKKGASAASKHNGATSSPSSGRTTTFLPEDIVNVYPVNKKAVYKSAMTEDLFERGQVLYLRGSPEHGEAFLGDALNFYEQIYGSVHPEVAEAYRTTANLYHRLAQPLVRRIQLYESLAASPREEDRIRAQRDTGFESDDAVSQAKAQHEAYLQQAARFTRQAVIISERTMGLDSPETLQCYSDLAIFEHSVGNVNLAMKLLKHAVALSNTMYGESHPERAKAAYFAASMMKSSKPSSHVAAIPFYRAAQDLANKAYGPNSHVSGNSVYHLAQCYIVDGQLAESIPYLEEALRIFETRMGKESDNAREATQLLAAVKQAIQQKEQGEMDKVQKLAKRIGSDPARAKELISKMQGGSTAGGGSAGKKAIAGLDGPSALEVRDANDRTGSRGHLAVDELVQYIQGSEKKASKGKSSKKTAGRRA